MRGKVRVHRYQHNNMESLEKFLAEEPRDAPKLVVTDGVFSMEGDIVKLPRLKELCTQHGARLYLDEAHALGVLGKTGRGTEEHYGRRQPRRRGDVHVLEVLRLPRRVRGG